MGARPYSPLLGRFLSADPIEGGSANDYDYVFADPINKTDTAGTSAFSDWWNGIRDTGWFKDTTNTLFTVGIGKLAQLGCRGLWSCAAAIPGGIAANHLGSCYIQAGFRFSAGSCYFSGGQLLSHTVGLAFASVGGNLVKAFRNWIKPVRHSISRANRGKWWLNDFLNRYFSRVSRRIRGRRR